MKLTKQKLLCLLVYFFLLINLFRDLLPSGTNQLIGAAIVIVLCFNLLPLRRRELLYISFYLISAVISIFTTDDIQTHIKYFVYFTLELSVMFLVIDNNNIRKIYSLMIDEKHTLRFVVNFYTLIILMMLLSNQCYDTDMWDGGFFFKGFSVPHGVAGSCSLAIVLTVLLINIDRKYRYFYIIDILVLLIAIVKAGTRTYLISSAALLVLVVFSLVKNKSRRILLLGMGMLVFVVAVVTSDSFQNKIQYAMVFRNALGWSFLDAFTSSRSIFWVHDLKTFFAKSNIVQIILGGGFAYSYEINELLSGRIHAHNGFIEILLSTGIIGFVFYFKLFCTFIKRMAMNNKWYFMTILLYVPLVEFWDDILQSPAYLMSFIFLYCIIFSLENTLGKNSMTEKNIT